MPKEMTAMQIMISMMNESVKQYSDNAQQESIFFALIEEAKKLLPVEKKQIVEAHSDGQTIKEIAGIAWKGAANAFRMYPENKHTFFGYWDAAKNQFAGYSAHPPAPAGMEEAVMSIVPTDLRIKEKAEEFLNEYASDFPPGNATCFAAGAKWMKDMLLTASTPPAKEQTSKLPGVDNTQVKPSDPQMVKEVP